MIRASVNNSQTSFCRCCFHSDTKAKFLSLARVKKPRKSGADILAEVGRFELPAASPSARIIQVGEPPLAAATTADSFMLMTGPPNEI